MAPPEAIPLSRLPHGEEAILLTRATRDADSGLLRGYRETKSSAVPLPSCLLIEMMAQTAGLGLPEGGGAVVAALSGVRIHRQAAPGESLEVEARLDRQLGDLFVFSCRALVARDIIADGEIVLRRT